MIGHFLCQVYLLKKLQHIFCIPNVFYFHVIIDV